jgi:hypothetical protein
MPMPDDGGRRARGTPESKSNIPCAIETVLASSLDGRVETPTEQDAAMRDRLKAAAAGEQ